jgi:predicted permease
MRWLVARLAPEELRQSLLDDLDEVAAAERAGRSRIGAAWWQFRQSGTTVMEVLKMRGRRRRDAAATAGPRPPFLPTLVRDIRYAVRLLSRSPGFTLMAVATLALGIGANTAIFSLVKTVLIEPLPYADPERLAIIWNPASNRDDPTWIAAPELVSYQQQATTIAKAGAYTTVDSNLTGGSEPERVHAGAVTGDLFGVLGVPAEIGRTIQPSDADPNAPGVIVLGHDLWTRRFGADRSMVGQSIQINGRAQLVIGVMPASFHLPLDYRSDQPTEAWLPLGFNANQMQSWGDHSYFGVARLRPGATAAQANAEFRTIENGWVRDGFRRDPGNDLWHRNAMPPQDLLSEDARRPLLLLLAAVAGVLLIACANVVNLLLVRADSRRHEVLVRAALGAERRTLILQALTESLVLSAAGAVAGLGVAWAGLRLLLALRPAGLPRIADVGIDGSVLAFTAVVAVVAALLFGAGPAVQFARANLSDALRDGGRTNTPSRARLFVGRLLVVGQLAASVVLVIGAGLLVRTMIELNRVNLGFNPQHVLTAQVQVPMASYPDNAATIGFYRRLIADLEAQPGVVSAGAIRVLPLSRIIGNWSITVEGRPPLPNENPNGDFQWTTPDYLKAIGATLVRGRVFADTDREDTPPVAIVNETMAQRYWPDDGAIGRHFRMGPPSAPWITVVGVLRNTHHNGVVEQPRAEMYLLHAQLPQTIGGAARGMDLVVRTTGDPMAFADALRATVRAIDPKLPLARIRTLQDVVAGSLSATRFAAVLLALFAALALTLAAIGTYGTMSLLVSSRTTEIGIRLALGAGRRSIFSLVVGHGLALAAAGVAIGLVGAAFASRLLGALLYGVAPMDLVSFLIAPVVLAVIAAIACATPAFRASRLDPISTLRGA